MYKHTPLFIFVVTLSLWASVLSADPVLYNGHYYEAVVLSATTMANALTQIKGKTYTPPGGVKLQGYLATVTSKGESDFINQQFETAATNAYISGSREANPNEWVYTSGPEIGQPIYSHSIGRCYTYCNWMSFTKTLDCYPNADASNYLAKSLNTWTNMDFMDQFNYIIEYGGMSDPVISQVPTVGGSVTISNFIVSEGAVNWNMPLVTITINNAVNGYAPVINQRTTDKIVATFTNVALPGTSTITITDGTRTITLPFRYQLPYASLIYPTGRTIGSLITISGSNFGNDPSAISVKFGMSSTPCTSVAIVAPHTAISCAIGYLISGTASLLPLNVAVSSSALYLSSPPVYHAQSMRAIRMASYKSNFASVASMINAAPKLEEQPATHAVLQSDNQERFANFMYPVSTSLPYRTFFQGLSGSFTGGFKYTSGPSINTLAINSNFACQANVYCTKDSTFTGSSAVQVAYNSNSTKLTSLGSTATSGEFVMYGISPASATNAAFTVPTSGGMINFNVAGTTGFKYSKRTFTLNGTITGTEPIIQVSSTVLQIPIPAGTGSNLALAVNIEGFSFTGTVNYMAPKITAATKAPTAGGIITITGTNLGNDKNALVINISGGSCADPEILTAHTVITCDAPVGTGAERVILLKVGGLATTFNTGYLAPSITSVSQSGTTLNLVGISLGRFGDSDLITFFL
eukprot:gene17525-20913_t